MPQITGVSWRGPDEAALDLLVEVARRATIAAQLTADGRLVASQLACDLADGDPLRVQREDLAAFIVLPMAVALGRESQVVATIPFSGTSPRRKRVGRLEVPECEQEHLC